MSDDDSVKMAKLLDEEIQQMLTDNATRYKELKNDYDPVTGKNAELYDPVTGKPLYNRKMVKIPDHAVPIQYLPQETLRNDLYRKVIKCGSIENYILWSGGSIDDEGKNVQDVQFGLMNVRYKTDFLNWAFCEWKIKDKKGSDDVISKKHFEKIAEEKMFTDNWDEDDLEHEPTKLRKQKVDYQLIKFRLNYAQFKLLAVFEKFRLEGLPIRVILVKCRQWGGSTLTQVYMAWIQLMLKNGWYSAIVAQQSSTAKKIYMMYEKGISQYSPSLLGIPDDDRLRFSQYGKSAADNKITHGTASQPIPARDVVVSIATYNNPTSLPGSDVSLAHYSEVALWDKTDGKEPEAIIRNVSGGMTREPLTMEVIESTALGSGNWFALEYSRAKNGESARFPLFVPFYYSIFDTEKVKDKRALAKWIIENKNSVNPAGAIPEHEGKFCNLVSGKYIYMLWKYGATLEGIMWYMLKSQEYNRHSDLASQCPADDVEAFANTEALAFDMYDINRLADKGIKNPLFIGDIISDYNTGKKVLEDYEFQEVENGSMYIWDKPDPRPINERYIVIVDIGGEWKGADWSVIRVFDRFGLNDGTNEKTVLMWAGHMPHDHVAWKACQVAKWYNNALLVFESNTLESKDKDRDVDDGNAITYILDKIDYSYDNLYARKVTTSEDMQNSPPTKYGFHTNKKTKYDIMELLKEVIRKADYFESDAITIDEYRTYERKSNGSYGSMAGKKDDRLMTAGIGLWVSRTEMDLPHHAKDVDKNGSAYSAATSQTINEASF